MGFYLLVPAGGVEPPRAYAHHPLKMACLPIPPRRLFLGNSILANRVDLSQFV